MLGLPGAGDCAPCSGSSARRWLTSGASLVKVGPVEMPMVGRGTPAAGVPQMGVPQMGVPEMGVPEMGVSVTGAMGADKVRAAQVRVAKMPEGPQSST
jgi:hypothetical protein